MQRRSPSKGTLISKSHIVLLQILHGIVIHLQFCLFEDVHVLTAMI